MDKDIDLGGRSWTPIGVGNSLSLRNSFLGSFNGQNKVIDNMYCYGGSSITGVGLFGVIAFKEKVASVIENLTIANAYIKAQGYAGAVVGYNEGATIRNCINEYSSVFNDSNDYTYTGGIVGTTYNTVENCINYGRICADGNESSGFNESPRNLTGGIVGAAFAQINNCKNYGAVDGLAGVGGIAGGILLGQRIIGTITIIESQGSAVNCINYGHVRASGKKGSAAVSGKITGGVAGGIAGYGLYETKIINCANISTDKSINVEAYAYAGGILGASEVSWNATGIRGAHIINCYNTAIVTKTEDKSKAKLGGVAGTVVYDWIKNCYYEKDTASGAAGDHYTDKAVSFDGKTLILASDIGYGNNLIDALNAGAIENNNQTVALNSWKIGENGYPTLGDPIKKENAQAALLMLLWKKQSDESLETVDEMEE